MPLSGSVITINAYRSGLNPDEVSGLPMILGPRAGSETGQVYAVGPEDDLASLIGQGPLLDALADHLSYYQGRYPYVLAAPVAKADAGTVGTVDTSGVSGLATLSVGSSCDMDAQVVIECTLAGGSGAAKVRISIDGGNNWEVVNKTVTAAQDIGIPDVGVTAQFDFTGGDMAEGDTWKFSTTAPSVTTTEIMNVVDDVLSRGYQPEFFVIPTPTDATDWATFAAQADYLAAQKRPAWFLTQAAKPTDLSASGLQTWVDGLVAEADGFAHPYVVVNAGYGDVAERSGRLRPRMLTGIASGIFARIQVNQSIGWRGRNPLPNVTLPEYYTQAMATSLLNAGYMPAVPRDFGRPAVFDKGRTMAADNHQFVRIEAVRTVFKAVRLLEMATEPHIESQAWQTAGRKGKATADDLGVSAIVTDQARALRTQMVEALPAAELDDFEIYVPAGQNLAADGIYEKVTLYGIPNIERVDIGLHFGWATWDVEITATA